MDNKRKSAKEILDTLDEKKENLESTYTELSDRLRDEKEKLQYELRHEYRNARRYVRANPEQGIGIAFATGIVVGLIFCRMNHR